MYTFVGRSRHLEKNMTEKLEFDKCSSYMNHKYVTRILSIHEVIAMALSKTNKKVLFVEDNL